MNVLVSNTENTKNLRNELKSILGKNICLSGGKAKSNNMFHLSGTRKNLLRLSEEQSEAFEAWAKDNALSVFGEDWESSSNYYTTGYLKTNYTFHVIEK